MTTNGPGAGGCGQTGGEDACREVSAPEIVVRRVSLAQLQPGDVGVIQDKKLAEDERAMLRAMGLACQATVKLCRVGEPCIVAVMSGSPGEGRIGGSACRIGLARALAEKIVVDVLEPR